MSPFNKKLLLLLSLLSLIPACTKPYFGYSSEQWQQLNDIEKQEAKQEYQKMLDTRQELVHERLIEQRTQSIVDHGRNPNEH